VGGYAATGDGGDWYRLGQVDTGSTISLAVSQPTGSGLSPVLGIHDVTGTLVAGGTAGATLSYAVGAGDAGVYYAQLSAEAGTEGLFSQYLLQVDVSDTLAPTVVSTSLGTEGEVRTAVLDRFTVTFSEDMAPATVNDVGNLDLREAGSDGTFDTADDDHYTLADTGYTAGVSAEYLISDGPLQPGSYRLTVSTGLTDRAGNPLASEFVRTLTVSALPGSTIENRSNDTQATATSLAFVEDPVGLKWAAGRGNLSSDGDVDYWSFSGTAGDLMSFAVETPGSWSPAIEYRIHKPDGGQLDGLNLFSPGRGQTSPKTLPLGGLYTIYVGSPWGVPYSGEYQLRIDTVTPPLQMESENNDTVGNADVLALSPGNPGHQVAEVGGYAATGDGGDWYRLGQVDTGSTISLAVSQPTGSGLSPVLGIHDVT
ncbi:MAG: Ig-like domain-containing protein, partial [bacterium]|nr:Ig-like domain-containing protein [bacterium]